MEKSRLCGVYIIATLLLLAITACMEKSTTSHTDMATIDYKSITKELEEMYDTDQGYRTKLTELIINKEPFDAALVNEMNTSDSINKIRMIEILDEYGWFLKEKVGEKAFNATFLVIQHADLNTMVKFYPGFRKIADQDSTILTSAALMQDRILMYQSKKQIYGSQSSHRISEAGESEYFIWPIENPEKVNELRKKSGFDTTIEVYASDLNAVYNPAEPLIKFGSN